MLSLLLLLVGLSFAEQKTFLSRVYTVDKIYTSMKGPSSLTNASLGGGGPRELYWVTGFKTEIVGEDGASAQKKEFMCHINLDYADPKAHAKLFGWKKQANERLFTLSQGQFALDLPTGFGVPVWSDERIALFTQVLNHNFKTGTFKVRHKVTVDYVKKPQKPLFAVSAFVLALVEGKDGYFSEEKPDDVTRHASCQPGQHAPGAPMGLYDDPYGRKFTGHWVIKPGKETRRTLVTKQLAIPYDTTIHYAAVHMHPFATSLELRDLTAGKTVLRASARSPKTGVGLEHIDYVSSPEGIPVYKDHQYELESAYDNTSGKDQDSMASVFLYLLDKDWQK
jgi:hypothetical protein